LSLYIPVRAYEGISVCSPEILAVPDVSPEAATSVWYGVALQV
jgi:hypothetical protein